MEILARFRGVPATDGVADGPSVNAPTTEELWRSRVDQAAKIIDGNVAEIERLRAALKPLLDHYLNCYDGIEDQIAKDAMTALGVTEPTVDLSTLKPIKDADRVENVEAALNEQSSVTRSCGCVFCDIKVTLHEDEIGPHHVVKGERVPCGLADR